MTTGWYRCSWLALILTMLLPGPLSAARVVSGSVSPSLVFWGSNTDGRIDHGSLTIDGGSSLTSRNTLLGYSDGGTGTVTVTGPSSKWTNSNELYVGAYGAAMVNVSDGGEVRTGMLYASLSDLHGNGTITATAGAILDADLVFDAAHGASQSIAFGSGGTLNVTASGGVLGAGYKQSGSFTISEGVNITSSTSNSGYGFNSNTSGYLGYWPGSTGAATVTGPGSKWINTSYLNIGGYGDGTLTIEAGGEVSNLSASLGTRTDSTGVVRVTGPDSKWTNSDDIAVGGYGDGRLSIEAGGQVRNNRGHIGRERFSTGTVTVTGAGSKWTNTDEQHIGYFDAGALSVGDRGAGTLLVEDGAEVTNTTAYLGRSAAGTATVSGAGSEWASSGALYIGHSSTGTLTIKAGGQVSNTTAHLGLNVFSLNGEITGISRGAVTVTGAGSKWTNSSNLYVGYRGAGTLLVEDGGQVSNVSASLGQAITTAYAAASATARATVSGAGSKWSNSRDLTIDYGTLTIKNGGLVSVGRTLSNDVNSSAECLIDMTTGGMLALYGDADDSLSEFLGLVEGNDFLRFRFWNHSFADWAPLTTATLGADYSLEYLTTGDLAGYTLLTVGEAIGPNLAGDFNGDGFVDAADYTIWRDGLGTVYSQGDYDLWANNYGATANARAEAVPEPTAVAIALLSLAAVGWKRAVSSRS
jgi:T5SS/PEP-CTERM-associated repeat protein